MSARDRLFEADFVDAAERQAGLAGLGFPEQVATRLEIVGSRHGDRWLQMSVAQLLREIREEGVDVAGWAALAAQRTLADPRDESLQLRLVLQAIASRGAQIERLVRDAVELLGD